VVLADVAGIDAPEDSVCVDIADAFGDVDAFPPEPRPFTGPRSPPLPPEAPAPQARP
jgi:hypothetical protein